MPTQRKSIYPKIFITMPKDGDELRYIIRESTHDYYNGFELFCKSNFKKDRCLCIAPDRYSCVDFFVKTVYDKNNPPKYIKVNRTIFEGDVDIKNLFEPYVYSICGPKWK